MIFGPAHPGSPKFKLTCFHQKLVGSKARWTLFQYIEGIAEQANAPAPIFIFFQPAAVTGIPKMDYFGVHLPVILETCMHIYTIYCYLIYCPTGIARGGREWTSPGRQDGSGGPMEGSHDCFSWGEL